jgi:hypothetical protein
MGTAAIVSSSGAIFTARMAIAPRPNATIMG